MADAAGERSARDSRAMQDTRPATSSEGFQFGATQSNSNTAVQFNSTTPSTASEATPSFASPRPSVTNVSTVRRVNEGSRPTSSAPLQPKKQFSFPSSMVASPISGPTLGVRKNFRSAPNYGDSSFTMLVGPKAEPRSFTIHEQLACEESDFIKATFHNEWKESEQKIIRLPDHSPEHFELFFLWLYNRTIFSCKEGDVPAQPLGSVDKEWDRLASAWVLGAYLQAPDFRDAVTDAITEKLSSCFFKFNQSMHEIIYANTDASAPIRKLIVDIATWRWDESILKAQKSDPAWSDFFYDLSVAMMSARKTADFGASPPWVKDPCAYHEHHKDSACYKSKCK